MNPMAWVQATNYFSGGDDHNHNRDHVRDDARDHNHNRDRVRDDARDHSYNRDHVRDDARDHNHSRHCVRVLVFLKHLQFQIYCHKLQVKQVYRLHRQENM